MSFMPSFPSFTPNTSYSFASSYPEPRTLSASIGIQKRFNVGTDSSIQSQALPGAQVPPPLRSQSPTTQTDLNRGKEGIVLESLKRTLAGQRPLGIETSRADEELHDMEMRLLHLDEHLQHFGKGFLLPPGCRLTQIELDRHHSPTPSEPLENEHAQHQNQTGEGSGSGQMEQDEDEDDGLGERDLDDEMEDMDASRDGED